jgi:myo-inositol 2-dehydrogenase/D-chiro-inositol 1-dehydrogenase
VCTASDSHAAVTIEAVRRGRPVICEKPIALGFSEAMAILKATTEMGGHVYPAHVVRFFGEYAAARKAVADGLLGDLAVLRFVRGGSRPSSAWFLDERLSGGLVGDLMVHDLDQARWFAGEVSEVFAVQNPSTENGLVPAEVVAHATLVHDSGAISHVQSFWGPPGLSFGPSFDIAGSQGRITSRAADAMSVREDLPGLVGGPASYLPPESAEESPYLAQLRELGAAALDGRPARVDLLDGVMAVALAEAARESIAVGRPVELSRWRDTVAALA